MRLGEVSIGLDEIAQETQMRHQAAFGGELQGVLVDVSVSRTRREIGVERRRTDPLAQTGRERALFVGLPVEQLYMWSALPFAGGAMVAFFIYVLNKARLKAHPELAKAQ